MDNKVLSELKRYLPVLEWLEERPMLWQEATKGTGIATLSGYKNALALSNTLGIEKPNIDVVVENVKRWYQLYMGGFKDVMYRDYVASTSNTDETSVASHSCTFCNSIEQYKEMLAECILQMKIALPDLEKFGSIICASFFKQIIESKHTQSLLNDVLNDAVSDTTNDASSNADGSIKTSNEAGNKNLDVDVCLLPEGEVERIKNLLAELKKINKEDYESKEYDGYNHRNEGKIRAYNDVLGNLKNIKLSSLIAGNKNTVQSAEEEAIAFGNFITTYYAVIDDNKFIDIDGIEYTSGELYQLFKKNK